MEVCVPVSLCCYESLSNLGRKEFLWLALPGYSPSVTEFRAVTETEATEECCSLAHSLMSCPDPFINTACLLRNGSAHRGLGSPTSKKIILTEVAMTPSDLRSPSVETLSVDFSCVKLTSDTN